jgi:hypothetical protein
MMYLINTKLLWMKEKIERPSHRKRIRKQVITRNTILSSERRNKVIKLIIIIIMKVFRVWEALNPLIKKSMRV